MEKQLNRRKGDQCRPELIEKGLSQAGRMLIRLPEKERKKLLTDIAVKNPLTAWRIKIEMINCKMLKNLDSQQLEHLLEHCPSDSLGLALRGVSRDVCDHVIENVSLSKRVFIEKGLKGKLVSVNDVDIAKNDIIKHLQSMVRAGVIQLAI
ncbi:hypothetical protein OAB57_01215 [Bacteriovoracaceae bacterium]|nr:hypothetical protein [Bacteriovoracaceae bacterium]